MDGATRAASAFAGVCVSIITARGDDCDICITDSGLSRRHAMLIAKEGRVSVADLACLSIASGYRSDTLQPANTASPTEAPVLLKAGSERRSLATAARTQRERKWTLASCGRPLRSCWGDASAETKPSSKPGMGVVPCWNCTPNRPLSANARPAWCRR